MKDASALSFAEAGTVGRRRFAWGYFAYAWEVGGLGGLETAERAFQVRLMGLAGVFRIDPVVVAIEGGGTAETRASTAVGNAVAGIV